jgi:hypothetical protein
LSRLADSPVAVLGWSNNMVSRKRQLSHGFSIHCSKCSAVVGTAPGLPVDCHAQASWWCLPALAAVHCKAAVS